MAPLVKNKGANIYPRTTRQRDPDWARALPVEAPRRSLRNKNSATRNFVETPQPDTEVPARRHWHFRVDCRDNSVFGQPTPHLQKSRPRAPDTIPEACNSKIRLEYTRSQLEIDCDFATRTIIEETSQESEPVRPAKRRRKIPQVRNLSSSPWSSPIQPPNKRSKKLQLENPRLLFVAQKRSELSCQEPEIQDSYETYRNVNLRRTAGIAVEIPVYADFDRDAYYRVSATSTQSTSIAKSSLDTSSPIRRNSPNHYASVNTIPDSQELLRFSSNEHHERDLGRSTSDQETPSITEENFELAESDYFEANYHSSQIQTSAPRRRALPTSLESSQYHLDSTRPAIQATVGRGLPNFSTVQKQRPARGTDKHTTGQSQFPSFDEDSESEDLEFLTQVPLLRDSSISDGAEWPNSWGGAADISLISGKEVSGSTSTEVWQGAQIVHSLDFPLLQSKSTGAEFEIYQDGPPILEHASQQDTSQLKSTNSVLNQRENNSQHSLSQTKTSRGTSQERHKNFRRSSISVAENLVARVEQPDSLHRSFLSPQRPSSPSETCGSVPDPRPHTPVNINMTDYEAVSSSSAMSIADQAKEVRDKVRPKFALSPTVVGFGPAASSPSGRLSYGMLPMRENVENFQTNVPLEDISGPDGSVDSSGDVTLRLPDLKPREHVILLPLASMVRDVYEAAIINGKRDLNAFLSGEKIDPTLLERINLLVEQLKMITDHQDLISPSPPALSDEQQAKWAVTCSTKCLFLQHLLDKMRLEDKHIAILVRPGKMLGIIESILKVYGYVYERLDRPGRPNSRGKGPLKISLLPTGLEGGQYVVGPADAVIAFDETFRASKSYSKILRQHPFEDDKVSPLISLVVAYSTEHLEFCLSSQVDDIERKLSLVNFITQTYEEVGKLDEELSFPEETVTAVAQYLQIDGGRYGAWPLPINPDITGLVTSNIQRVRAPSISMPQSYEQHPQGAMKRSLRAESISGADIDSTKRMRMTPTLGDVGSSGDISRISDSAGHRSGAIPTSTDEASHDAFEKVDELEDEQSRQISLLLGKVGDLQAEIQTKRATEEKLQQLVKHLGSRLEDHISTIQKFAPKLRQALSDRGKYQGERDAAKSHAATLTQAIDARIADIAKLKEDKSSLEQDLSNAREAMRNSTIPGVAQLAQAQEQIRNMQDDKERLEKRVSNIQRDFEFTRDAYQKASSYTTELSSEVAQLKEENALLARKASDNTVRIAEIQRSNETQDREARIDELEALLRDREQELRKKSEELKIKTNGRRETRGTSVPRSPRMGSGAMSPRPHFGKPGGGGSRGGSPAPGDVFRDPTLFPAASALASSRWQHLT